MRCARILRVSAASGARYSKQFDYFVHKMNELEVIARLAMSMFFGMLVGVERQWHHKSAGIKTNTLVSVGAAAFALISLKGFGPTNNPAAVASGVVTGIGFIGAGVIMRRGGSIQGINTAATLWAAASMGLSIGQGYYELGFSLLATILLIQAVGRPIAAVINKRSGLITPLVTYRLDVRFRDAASDSVHAIWSSFAQKNGVLIVSFSETTGSSEMALEASLGLSELRATEMIALAEALASTTGVVKASWSQTTTDEPE